MLEGTVKTTEGSPLLLPDSVANGASNQGQTVAAVVVAVREARAPVDHQERLRRSEVSGEEFERRQTLVKKEFFWVCL